MIVNVGKGKPVLWPHWLAAVEVSMLSMVVGLVTGWSSPYLAKLTRHNDELMITEEEASWIAGIVSLGRIGGAIAGALMIDYFGTKIAVLFTGVSHALGWLLLLVPSSVWLIYVARFFGGFGIGMYFGVFPLYMGEISSPKIRGALISLIVQGMRLGVLLGNAVGASAPMWIFSCVSLVPNIIFLVSFAAMPHSPHYLILRDRMDEAKKSLEWYNRDVDVTPELESLREFLAQRKSITYRKKIGSLLSVENRRAVMIISVLAILAQLCGFWTMTFYMEIILTKAGLKVIDPSLMVIIIGVLGIVFGSASMYTNDKCGRKTMLASSCFIITLSYVSLGINYQLLEMDFSSEFLTQWLPIITIVTFQCALTIGFGPVPATLMSEMFSPDVKSTATCMANLCSAVFAFITVKTYQPMLDLTSAQTVFWLYGMFNFFLAIFAIVCIPETKGKSLQEIQDILRRKKLSKTSRKDST